MSDKMIQMKLPFPKEMTAIRATNLIDGFEEGSEQDLINAYQFLIDTGLVWSLQGRYGRTALQLIDQGICEPNSLPYSLNQYSC